MKGEVGRIEFDIDACWWDKPPDDRIGIILGRFMILVKCEKCGFRFRVDADQEVLSEGTLYCPFCREKI